jgi:hypothetical protein
MTNPPTRTTYRRIRRLPDGTEISTVHDCVVWYPQWTRWVVTDRGLDVVIEKEDYLSGQKANH